MGFYCVQKPRLSISSCNCACKSREKNTSTNEEDGKVRLEYEAPVASQSDMHRNK